LAKKVNNVNKAISQLPLKGLMQQGFFKFLQRVELAFIDGFKAPGFGP
jgi:hypothetical protein